MLDLRHVVVAASLLLCCDADTTDLQSEVSVYQFQDDDAPSDSYLSWQGDLPNVFHNVTSLTICARLQFFSVWEVSRYIQLTDEATGQHNIQIDLDVRRISVSIGGLRRYHKLNTNLRALTWHHVCFTVDDSTGAVATFMDGIKQDEHLSELRTGITGTKLKIGAGDIENNFHGQLTQVNIWSRPLYEEEINKIAMCRSDSQGNVVPWNSDWKEYGTVVKSTRSLNFFCKTIVDPKYYLFPEMRLLQGFKLCSGLGGDLPTPENKTTLTTTRMELNNRTIGHPIQCKGYWLGTTDETEEGTWIKMNDGLPITPYWRPSEPDGGEVQNCARGTLQGDHSIEDIPCDWKQCVLCVIKKLPVWSLLGTCQIHDRNRLFAVVQHTPGNILFEGYSYYSIEKRNDTWYWIEKDGMQKNHTVATLIKGSSIRKSWPIGRNSWSFEKSVCDEEPLGIRTLLLSPCEEGHFTCDDATCIPLFQRCDLKPDCRDGSDEKDCRLVQFHATYRPDIPPAALGSENPLPVALHITIESADINTSSMEMHVNFNLTMTWLDPRLEFLNLNEDRTLNRVKQEMVNQLWVPVVDFTNTKGNHYTLADHESTMMVNMQSIPSMGDDTHAEEVEVYPGTMNSLSIRRKYSKTFQCQFDLTRYPFDKQGCEIEMTMLSASSRLLQFHEEDTEAEFSGNRHLIEYTVGDVKLHFHNDRDFAVLMVEVELERRAGFILMNVYIPSMCLLVISYLTLYFKPAIFQVRMLGSLTTLLVMATLFTQASSQLPKSSSFKLVDVWLLSSILIIFMIIVFHAIIDRLQDTPRPEIPKNPLSAIIVKPDMTQVKSPVRKAQRRSPRYSIKSETHSRSRTTSQASTPAGSPSHSVDATKQQTSTSPGGSSVHESHELVTTLSRLGVNTEECSSSLSPDGTPRKKLGNKNSNNCNEGSSNIAETNIGRTYREPQNVRKRDSFVAMETADGDEDDVYDGDDYKKGMTRSRIEWRFWKWSFKDVDKCRTMIVTSRIFILGFVLIFNIIYWSIALGTV